ncbi:MAG TPA: hypothetical protein VHY20_00530 [Pirellulales bacterium]|nr:hypothetical protein [Pirellulales bacterium]
MWRKLARTGWAARALLLTAAMLVLGLAMAPVAWLRDGPHGLLAEAIAGGLSLAGAALGLAAFAWFSRPDQVLQALAAGMLLRTFLPLAAAAGLYLAQPALAAAGLLVYLLVFYLPALAFETALVVLHVGSVVNAGSSAGQSRAGASRLECQHGRH